MCSTSKGFYTNGNYNRYGNTVEEVKEMREKMALKIIHRHPNTVGLTVSGSTKCEICGRKFDYIVDNGKIWGNCCREGCLELEGVSLHELEIEKIRKNLQNA